MTRLNGCELARIHMGSEEERKRASLIAADNDQMVEPLFRSNQMYVERYLLKQVRLRPRITLRFGCTVTDFSQDAHGVVVQSHNAEGDLETWNASYLMGCDGGQSVVRRTLGIDYQGPDGAIGTGFMTGQMISTHVRVEGLTSGLLQGREAWLYNILNQDHRVLLFSLNGQDDFVMMSKRDCKIGEGTGMLLEQLRSSFGVDIPCTLLSSSAWTGGHALVAEGFRIGRVFLAGDAAHLFSPTDGLGMNTGIDDVANLAWKLAAIVQGWGGENLIHTYETERRPIAVRNTSAARDLSRRIGEVVIHESPEDETIGGNSARTALGDFLKSFRGQFDAPGTGIELRARYDSSTIVFHDALAPPDNAFEYIPSSVPGGRLPHLWVDPAHPHSRRSIFDLLGSGFALLRIDLPLLPAWDLYQRRLILIGPDQHIAWRGDTLPSDIFETLTRCIGMIERKLSAQENNN
jgi:2-polyprenyl-6-methoxyphenol hydroxylase-like FAD-dependent oxidoreductase